MIDTSILATIGKNERFEPPLDGNKGITPFEPKNERETDTGRSGRNANRVLQREADKRQSERERYRQGIAKQQDAIRKSGTLRSDILKGIKRGEDIASLLLKACECISLQTGDSHFYKQASEDIKAIYGHGLGEPHLLEQELQETMKRLELIQAAAEQEQDAKTKQRLLGAARAHRSRIDELKESLQK